MTNTINKEEPPQKKSAVVPLIFLGIYVVVLILLKIYLPPAKEILAFIQTLYAQFGYLIIFVSGFLEAIFLVGSYFPGSSAILLGAALSKTGVVFLPLVILLGTLSLTMGYTINYFLGKHGWYKILEKFGLKQGIVVAQRKLHDHQKKTLILGYISPTTGSFVSTAAGVAGIPFKTFLVYTILSQLGWSTVWGVAAYLMGVIFVEYFLQYGVIVIYTIVGFLLLRHAIKSGFFRFF